MLSAGCGFARIARGAQGTGHRTGQDRTVTYIHTHTQKRRQVGWGWHKSDDKSPIVRFEATSGAKSIISLAGMFAKKEVKGESGVECEMKERCDCQEPPLLSKPNLGAAAALSFLFCLLPH
jgi:hypothetical protein